MRPVSSARPGPRSAVHGAADVVAYLLARGLVRPRSVVHGALTVDDRSHLNRVFLVRAEGERHLVVKAGPRVAREAAILERLRPVAGLAQSLPRVVAHDRAEQVLVLEAPPGARDLVRHHARGRFSRSLAAEAGRSLALLHALPPAALDGVAPVASAAPPHRPDLDTLRSLSGAAVELTRIVQASGELCAALDELAASRPPAVAVVHGDVRWGNCVVLRRGSRGWKGLQLVDWELCRAGDPAVDVGAFIGEYLAAWLRSMPIADPRDPGALREHAQVPMQRLRPAVQAFWRAYADRIGTPAGSHEMLRRSLRFAAVRLLGTAFEQAQAAAELRPGVLGLLPLTRNVLHRPHEAAELLELA
jgi:aminoglycoside phosphotransferase (APT) family kinase protein